MATKDLVRHNGEQSSALSRFADEEFPSFSALQREMARWMQDWDNFLSDFASPRWNRPRLNLPVMPEITRFTPPMDVREGDNEYTVTAELPGIDPKDVEITVQEGALLIRGEKKYEKETKGEGYHRMERSYGSFRRTITLPKGVDTEHIDATFHNGVLTLTIPKPAELKPQARKIEIKSAEPHTQEPVKK